ncbi:amidohydrolase 2 [Lizonia empirigonia]|nr:amidohydrolase 2 [Lizonia empirigonia]
MGKIDVHHHMLPAEYVEKWKGASGIPTGLTLPPWDVKLDLAFMDRNGIDASILSLSAPGLGFVKSADEALKLCRWVNEYAAKIVASDPFRFGFFATLPPLDQTGPCLEELRYSLDVLKADGVAVLSSYDDKYLGHQDFQPIWKELHHRNTVVFVHPSFGKTWTTRTAVNLITSNTIRDFPNCRIILSHGGGTLPYVATRIANQTADLRLKDKSADSFLRDAKNFYYDLALSGYEGPVKLLTEFAQVDHILYGSDFPFAREETIKPQIGNIKAAAIDDNVRVSIDCGAAKRLFPRFCEQRPA